ncbi:MAG: hypothetical protein AB7K68_07870 [Bacteriovoracia bacterium]
MTLRLNKFYLIATLALIPQLGFGIETDSAKGIDTIVGGKYRTRYQLPTAGDKLLDNYGNGHDSLYGLRNTRAVLNGVYYRGGANNYYNKHKKRSNSNPLPKEGLENLCKEGFTRAVYLYAKNYNTAKKQTRCRTYDNVENTLEYVQISPLSYRPEDLDLLHSQIFEHVRDPRRGPMYAHCWNGWHASGYVAATTLRQFCGFTAEQAVAYWDQNTDGFNTEPGFETIRGMIRSFTVNPSMQLTSAEKAALCPAPDSLAYQPR